MALNTDNLSDLELTVLRNALKWYVEHNREKAERAKHNEFEMVRDAANMVMVVSAHLVEQVPTPSD